MDMRSDLAWPEIKIDRVRHIEFRFQIPDAFYNGGGHDPYLGPKMDGSLPRQAKTNTNSKWNTQRQVNQIQYQCDYKRKLKNNENVLKNGKN